MKQVVFNALQTSLSGGIGRYSYELAKGMYKLNKLDLKIVIREEDKKLFSFANKDDLVIAKGIKDSKSRNYYEQFKLPQLIYKLYPKAIIHYPDSMAPLLAKNKVVITIHDLAFKSLKNVFTWKTLLWKNVSTSLSVRKAFKIISITNFTKSEIIRHYPNIDLNKIEVIYNGFNDFAKDTINERNIRKSIKDIKKPYILTVSTISPRKNVDGLVNAFNIIKDRVDSNLVIVGNNGWLYEEVYELVKRLDLSNRVIFTGSVNDDELKYLYKNSKVFTYISLYEGFGLPPLEALSFKIPCIVSNNTSMPEVLGDSAVYVEPNNIKEISDKILTLINDINIQNKLKNNSQKTLNNYNWDICSSNVIEVYTTKNKKSKK